MGTNFFCRYRVTPEKHKTFQELLNDKKYDELEDEITSTRKSYHIGKRSDGWQFLFQSGTNTYNIKENPWEDTLQSLKDFLARDDVEIYNEYGEFFTSEDFWEEINYCLYNDENHVNSEQYYRKFFPNYPYSLDNFEFTTDEGLRFSHSDFS